MTNPSTVASVLIAVTVNGMTATYAPTMFGEVEAYENWLSVGLNLGGAPLQDFSQDGVEVFFKQHRTIGAALQPSNPPLLGNSGDFIYLEGQVARPNGSLPLERLTFSVSKAYN